MAPSTTVQNRPHVLCVDDEPNVLQGLRRQLRSRFVVVTAEGGAAGLDILSREESFAIVVSDMRMPGMDGAAFLRRVREQKPDTVRILLTGQTDLDAAIAAVNEGNIFRFLTKPCPLETLLPALDAAAEQHRLITAERVLLEETLHGSVKALTDILALTNPAGFGRATRVRNHVARLAGPLAVECRWQLEVAAMLSQIGAVTLPPELAEKMYHGDKLAAAEAAMVQRLPEVAEQLLASIPRLEPVREIIRYENQRYDGAGLPRDGVRGEKIPIGARILKVVLDFDTLETQGMPGAVALQTLRERSGWYDATVLDALGEILGDGAGRVEVREVSLSAVAVGMTFVDDVVTRAGLLLIARGQAVTPGLLERIGNFSRSLGVKEPLKVTVPLEPSSDPAPEGDGRGTRL